MLKKRVGILGTSANPLHEGHVALALEALAVAQLDEVLFMVNQNPFKEVNGFAPVAHRLHLAHLGVRASGHLGNGLKVSEFEVVLRQLGTENATAVMLAHFSKAYPELQPVWMMGTDNFVSLHTWGGWRDIMEKYPVVVFGRDQSRDVAQYSIAATQYQTHERDVVNFDCEPGTWCFVDGVSHLASSTLIREALLRKEKPEFICDEAVAYIRKYQLFGCV